MTIPVAFYAPLKAPDAPSPSGDRTMARQLLAALRQGGFAPELVSTLRSFEPAGDPGRQAAIRAAGHAEADRLLKLYRTGRAAPRLWFTYHCYYKAPDWIGPAVAAGLGIPYVIAEGSRATRRADGPWAIAHGGATAALDAAAIVFALTDHDAEALRRDAPAGQAVIALPPFLDLADWPAPPRRDDGGQGPLRLVAVGMMREGDKLASYRALAATLACLSADAATGWRLTIAGDGPARAAVEAAFAAFGDRVNLVGALDRPALADLYAASDLLVWPAVNEAYGMALLEAQAMGCPVLAGREGGVPSVLGEGETGLLVPPRDPNAFAAALAALIRDPAQLAPMRNSARGFVRRERDLPGAAARLRAALAPLLQRSRAA